MRRLLLLRHAKAERSLPGAADRERMLTEDGRQEASLLGRYLTRHALMPDRVLVSPAARALETWTCAARSLSPAPDTATVESLYDATAHDILAAIRAVGAAAPTVLAIGHNPGLHEAAVTLVAAGDLDARERLREGLPTCGLAVIDFVLDDWGKLHWRSGRLERFVTPRSLEAAAQ
jgi:phosphohistidine phosphatase